MTLRQNCQFGGVAIAGTNLERGTYTYAQLIAQFPENFAAGGTGSITVAPSQPFLTLTVTNTTASTSFQTSLAHNYLLQASDALGPDANWTKVRRSPFPAMATIPDNYDSSHHKSEVLPAACRMKRDDGSVFNSRGHGRS